MQRRAFFLCQSGMIKTLLLTLLCGSLILTVSSCCKEACTDRSMMYVDFSLFKKSELNTIVKLSYELNSNFTTLVDSTTITNQFGQDTTQALHVSEFLSLENDYIIKIPATGNSYTISNYQYKKTNCNCGTGQYNELSGFSTNGVAYNSEQFQPSR